MAEGIDGKTGMRINPGEVRTPSSVSRSALAAAFPKELRRASVTEERQRQSSLSRYELAKTRATGYDRAKTELERVFERELSAVG